MLDKLPPPRKKHLQVKSDLNALTQILSWFELAYEPQIPKQVWLRCELAFAEGFTNAVRHAHKNLPRETPIEMEVTISEETIEIRIWDYGLPFDLEAELDKRPITEDNESGGGRGLQLIQKTTDRFTYKRNLDNRNCLLMVKFYK